MINEETDYKVEEPSSDTSLKRSLKRTFSDLNRLSIEEIDARNNIFNDTENCYYFVDEPTTNNSANNLFLKTSNNKNSLKITEILEDSGDSMEL